MTLRPDYGVYNYDRVTTVRTRGNCIEKERARGKEGEDEREKEMRGEGRGALKHIAFN